MGKSAKDDEKTIVIKPPKRRVRTPLKTGTVVHKSPKVYTRREKHRKAPKEPGDE